MLMFVITPFRAFLTKAGVGGTAMTGFFGHSFRSMHTFFSSSEEKPLPGIISF